MRFRGPGGEAVGQTKIRTGSHRAPEPVYQGQIPSVPKHLGFPEAKETRGREGQAAPVSRKHGWLETQTEARLGPPGSLLRVAPTGNSPAKR